MNVACDSNIYRSFGLAHSFNGIISSSSSSGLTNPTEDSGSPTAYIDELSPSIDTSIAGESAYSFPESLVYPI